MHQIRQLTIRAIHDALSLRGLEDGGGGFIRTSVPADYMTPERLRLAREVAKHLPDGATVLDADRLAERIEGIVETLRAAASPARDD
jgi:hypothetical protein